MDVSEIREDPAPENALPDETLSALTSLSGEMDGTLAELNCGALKESSLSNLAQLDNTPEFELKNLQIDEVAPPVMPEPPLPSPEIARPAGEELDFAQLDSANTPKRPRSSSQRGSEKNRARAEEINSGSKVVPRVEVFPSDYFGLAVELEAWFSMGLESGQPSILALITSCTQTVLPEVFANAGNTVPAAVETIVSRVRALGELDIIDLVLKDDFESHTMLFLYLCVQVEAKTLLLDRGVALIAELLEQVSLMRWIYSEEDDNEEDDTQSVILQRLLVLLRLAILATLGDSHELKKTHKQMWEFYGLELPADGSGELASPISYARFMDDIERRYPAYSHEFDANHELGLQLKERLNTPAGKRGVIIPGVHDSGSSGQRKRSGGEDPASLVNNKPVMPYVPVSIVEACELFKANVQPTPQLLQLYEQLRFGESEKKDPPFAQVSTTKKIYKSSLGVQKSFVGAIVGLIQRHDGKKGSMAVHAALSSVCLLLRWFEVSHILMFESLSAVLFDYRFYFVAHVFCQRFPKILQSVLHDYTLTGHSVFWEPLLKTYEGGPQLKWAEDGVNSDLIISDCNMFNLQIYTHLITILRLIVVGKAQRMLVVAEMPVEPFKELFNIHEQELWTEILQLFKSLIPFTSKRWRYMNIELISAIYLYCPSRIDDNWLNGTDLNTVMSYAAAEEYELRKLVETYSTSL